MSNTPSEILKKLIKVKYQGRRGREGANTMFHVRIDIGVLNALEIMTTKLGYRNSTIVLEEAIIEKLEREIKTGRMSIKGYDAERLLEEATLYEKFVPEIKPEEKEVRKVEVEE